MAVAAAGWADRVTDPAGLDLGLDWVAQEDQAAVGLAVVVEQVEVAVPEAAVALACGILGFPVAAEVARGQARVGPVEEVGPAAVAGVWAVLEGAAELPEDLALGAGVVLEVVEDPALGGVVAAREQAVEVA